jgi:hypothetical protein
MIKKTWPERDGDVVEFRHSATSKGSTDGLS